MHASPTDAWSLFLVAAAGIALAAACGLRAFLPMLALAVGARLGIIPLRPGVAWLASEPAIWTLGLATVVELVADKVPVLDHALDVLATFVRPAAAALVVWASFQGLPPALTLVAALTLGTGALGLHAAKAKARVASSLVTFGIANPLLSFFEDAVSASLSAFALLAPLVALALVAIGGWLIVRTLLGGTAPRSPRAGPEGSRRRA